MLEIRDLRKSFDTKKSTGQDSVSSQKDVLKGINLSVKKGDVVALIGPSGSGKTTLLRCINFLEKADAGTMIFLMNILILIQFRKKIFYALEKKLPLFFKNTICF